MYLHSIGLKNFRRLNDVHIDLESHISIFVGANNSGKTSATRALELFTKGAKEFSIHDFSAGSWKTFDSVNPQEPTDDPETVLPTIQLDLWFTVKANDLHRALDLLPKLDWSGSLVGMRVEFEPKDTPELLKNFREAFAAANEDFQEGESDYCPWPKNLTDYLSEELSGEYALKYYVLNPEEFENFRPKDGYQPSEIRADKGRSGAQILNSLMRVDCLSAQRHLSDQAGSRVEEISKVLSRFYSRNLEQHSNDSAALRALSDSETQLP
jgi:predicted ATP-dependent endonuclease of OLD family